VSLKDNPLIIALDLKWSDALDLAKSLDPNTCKLKIGSQLFTSVGPESVTKLNSLGFDIFLDLKFHDIPNTVQKAIRSAINLDVWMLNVHISGGREMLLAAVEECNKSKRKPLLIGVTLLTSLEEPSMEEVGIGLGIKDHVLKLAKLSRHLGLDGVVCSPNEIKYLRKEMGDKFVLVTPGIRSNSNLKDDQRRTSTALEALSSGANYIVIGREITSKENPSQEVNKILKEIYDLD